MNWYQLDSLDQLDQIVEESKDQAVVIFKHSTRCSISTMAKSRVERQWAFEEEDLKAYYLDLIAHRDISNEIVEKFGVVHQSPQVLLIKDGVCVYNESHNAISVSTLEEAITPQ